MILLVRVSMIRRLDPNLGFLKPRSWTRDFLLLSSEEEKDCRQQGETDRASVLTTLYPGRIS